MSVSWGITESTVLIILIYICWCLPYFNCYFINNTQYKYPVCPLEKWTVQFENMNHVRILGKTESTALIIVIYICWCFPHFNCYFINNTKYEYPECPFEKWTMQFGDVNHVRILRNDWINSTDNSDTFSGVFLILIVISKTTPNINIPSVPSKKWTVQFEYLANFTHRMSDFRHWIFECPMSNVQYPANFTLLAKDSHDYIAEKLRFYYKGYDVGNEVSM